MSLVPTWARRHKELYSLAGLLLIKEFMDWTTTRAAEGRMFEASVQYALNLYRGPEAAPENDPCFALSPMKNCTSHKSVESL